MADEGMPTATVEFFGQACTLLDCGSVSVLSDPWFSGPAHLDSWLPVPQWSPDEIESMRVRLDRATHIYISHNHQDHFDPEFLHTLSPKIIIVGRFRKRKDVGV